MAEPRKAKKDVPAWEVLRNEFRGLDGLPCYEREFEPKTVGLNEATRVIALRDDVLVSSAIAIGGVEQKDEEAMWRILGSNVISKFKRV